MAAKHTCDICGAQVPPLESYGMTGARPNGKQIHVVIEAKHVGSDRPADMCFKCLIELIQEEAKLVEKDLADGVYDE